MAFIDRAIRSISKATLTIADPEVDSSDITVARTEKVECDAIQDVNRSVLHRRTASLLDTDLRYHGERVTRRSYHLDSCDEDDLDGKRETNSDSENGFASGNDTAGEVAHSEDEEGENVDDGDDDGMCNFTDKEGDLSHGGEDDACFSGVTDDGGDDENEDGDESAFHGDGKLSGNTNAVCFDEDVSEDKQKEDEKAVAVIDQMNFADRLMEARIQLQQLMSLTSSCPSMTDVNCPQQQEADSVMHQVLSAFSDLDDRQSMARKRKLGAENDVGFDSFRDSTLTYWDDRTRLASKKFCAFNTYNTGIVKNIEQVLCDRNRLIQRTRVYRGPRIVELESEEVFDDGDFYQRWLKQVVEGRSVDATSPASHSHWLQLQSLTGRKRSSKLVDTRASKGRKLRYNIHNKLVNFMAPVTCSHWSEESKNDLFKNLFRTPTLST